MEPLEIKNILWRPDVNLQQICAVSLSSRLWDIKQIKQEIKKFSIPNTDSIDHPKKTWNEIEDLVFNQFDVYFRLPKMISSMFTEIIAMMGGKIQRWIKYVTEKLCLSYKFAEELIWTCIGTIDEEKIFKNIWRRNSNNFKENGIFQIDSLFVIGCALVQEDFIAESKEEIVDALSKEFPFEGVEIQKNEMYDIVALTLALHKKNNKETLEEFVTEAISDTLLPIKMFKRCLFDGYVEAAKLFWKKASDDVKKQELLTLIELCVSLCNGVVNDRSHEEEKQIQILSFLINEAFRCHEAQSVSFLRERFDDVLNILLSAWPYQESSVDLFNRISYSLPLMVHGSVFLLIAQSIKKIRNRKFKAMESTFQKIFIQLFEQLTSFYKQDIFTEQKLVLKEYFGILNGFFLTIFVEDEDFRYLKLLIIREGLEFLETKDMKFLNEFLKVVSELFEQIDVELEDCFVRLCENFIKNHQMPAAEKILDFLSYENWEERLKFKKLINATRVCKDLILNQWRYDLAEDFLNWKFCTTEEKLQFKQSLPSEWYIYNRCVEIWLQNASEIMSENESEVPKKVFNFSYNGLLDFFITTISKKLRAPLIILINSESVDDLKVMRYFKDIGQPNSQKKFMDNLIWWKNIYGKEFKIFDDFQFIFTWSHINESQKELAAEGFEKRGCGYLLIRMLIFLILGSRNMQ